MKPYGSVRQERGRVGCRCCPDKAARGPGRRGTENRQEIENELPGVADFLDDPCAIGTCPFCMGDWEENEFERTRMYAAQRGAI